MKHKTGLNIQILPLTLMLGDLKIGYQGKICKFSRDILFLKIEDPKCFGIMYF